MNNQTVHPRPFYTIFAAIILLSIASPAFAQKAPAILLPAMELSNAGALKVQSYYSYLKEMAPRLKSYGIDAVWVSPFLDDEDATPSRSKPTSSPDSTSMEYKEMIAALRANGIGVIYHYSPVSRKLSGDRVGTKMRDLKDASFFIPPHTKRNVSTPRLTAGHDDFHSL